MLKVILVIATCLVVVQADGLLLEAFFGRYQSGVSPSDQLELAKSDSGFYKIIYHDSTNPNGEIPVECDRNNPPAAGKTHCVERANELLSYNQDGAFTTFQFSGNVLTVFEQDPNEEQLVFTKLTTSTA